MEIRRQPVREVNIKIHPGVTTATEATRSHWGNIGGYDPSALERYIVSAMKEQCEWLNKLTEGRAQGHVITFHEPVFAAVLEITRPGGTPRGKVIDHTMTRINDGAHTSYRIMCVRCAIAFDGAYQAHSPYVLDDSADGVNGIRRWIGSESEFEDFSRLVLGSHAVTRAVHSIMAYGASER